MKRLLNERSLLKAATTTTTITV